MVYQVRPVSNLTSCIKHVHIYVYPGTLQTAVLFKNLQAPLNLLFCLCPQVLITAVLLQFLQILLNLVILVLQLGLLLTEVFLVCFVGSRHDLPKFGVVFICHTRLLYSEVHHMHLVKGWIIRLTLIAPPFRILVCLLMSHFVSHILVLRFLCPMVDCERIFFHLVAHHFLCYGFLLDFVKTLLVPTASFR